MLLRILYLMKNVLIENLKQEMAKRQWNGYDLEKASGVPQPTIHRILTGKHGDPRTSTIRKLAEGLGITEAQLRGFENNADTKVTEQTAHYSSDPDRVKSKPDNELFTSLPVKMIPVLSQEQAKNWMDFINKEQREAMIPVSKEAQAFVTPYTFAFTVLGDSMSPDALEGDIALIDPQRTPAHKNWVLAEISGDVVIRQLWIEAGDSQLRATNPHFPPKPLSGSMIIGVVVTLTPKPKESKVLV
jgi:SOS-response transcriptional repressor LexA